MWPQPGQVYWVLSRAYAVIGNKEDRPAVVLAKIAGTDEWWVWPRTSRRDRPGLDHARSPSIGCNKDGRFCLRDVARLPEHVLQNGDLARYTGMLEPDVFQALRDRWEG